MHKWILLLCFIVMGCSQKPPDRWHDLDGNTVRLEDARGKWVLINYWADWCGPCRSEIPALNAFAKAHSNDVLILGVNYDHLPLDRLKNAVAMLGIQYPVLQEDPSERLGVGSIAVVPVTYRINPKGEILSPLVGPQNDEQLNAAIR